MINSTKKKLKHESLIAGALLKFESVDILDIEMLCIFLEEAGFSLPAEFDYKFPHIDGYINCEDSGKIYFRRGLDIEGQIKGTSGTMRELFESVAGRELTEFFRTFDIKRFEEGKNRKLEEEKQLILNSGSVLLISDKLEDYTRFRRYGFKNVDYFSSVVRAEIYFTEKPQELEKYQIIAVGSHLAIDHFRNLRLSNKIRELKTKKRILEVDFSGHVFDNRELYFVTLYNYRSWRSYYMSESKLTDAMNDIIMGAIVNEVPDSIRLDAPFVPADIDKGIVRMMPFPKKKKDLKILLLSHTKDRELQSKLENSLGVNITIKEEDNYAFEDIVWDLGEYDIIIGSDLYSGRIPLVYTECSTQCKYTGRPLVTLVSYKDHAGEICSNDVVEDNYVKGSNISLQYSYGGYSLQEDTFYRTEYVAPRIVSIDIENDGFVQYDQKRQSDLESVLEVAVRLYNDKAGEMGNRLQDALGFKSPSEFYLYSRKLFEEEKSRREELLMPIRMIDDISGMIKDFLKYRKLSLIIDKIPDINIRESETGHRVEIVLKGKVLSSLTFSKGSEAVKNLRVFNIQMITKKGTLSAPVNVGVYPDVLKQLNVPRRPDEREWSVINAIYKKLQTDVLPIIESAKAKEEGQNSGKVIRIYRKDDKKA